MTGNRANVLGLWAGLALVALVHSTYLLSAHFGFFDRLANDLWQFSFVSHDPGVDYFVVYEAGWDFLNNRNMYLHSENVLYPDSISFEERYARSLEDGTNRAPWYATFRYIPFFAVTMGVLLNVLPPWGAFWFWILLTEALLWINCTLTWRRCRNDVEKLLAAALWFIPFPLCIEFFLGQFNVLMASLIFWTALSWSSGENNKKTGYLFWILSVLLKNYTAALSLILLKHRRWRVVLLCAFIVLITTLPYFLIFPEGWNAFWGAGLSGRVGVDAGEWGWRMFGMQGFQAGISAICEILGIRTISIGGGLTIGILAGVLISALLVGLAIWRTYTDENWLRPFCLWILLWFVLYRDCWEHHYIMALPVMALCLIYGLVSLRALCIVFLLTQTATMYSMLLPEESATVLRERDLYDILMVLYYTIKPIGISILIYNLAFPKKG